MGLQQQQSDHQYLLRLAQQMLGVPVRGVNFAWDIQQRLEKRMRLVRSEGLETNEPLVEIDTSRSGIDVDAGLAHYQLSSVKPVIDLVHVISGECASCCCPRYDFWAVPTTDYDRLFRYIRKNNHKEAKQVAPIMEAMQQTNLWNQTIGFLQQSVQVLSKYGVSQRRGILLIGEPGNGKTMAARWLRHECRQHRLAWKTITADQYEEAVGQNALKILFHLRRPGIVQFDDLDRHMRDRNQVGTTGGHQALLTELDGIEPRHGVVYLFTSNAQLQQLDPAIRRPGRIDQIIEFPRPSEELRSRLVRETWHADITEKIDISEFVTQTDRLSFADLDEIKKLMVLGFLDLGEWDWKYALRAFQSGQRKSNNRPIGFQSDQSAQRTLQSELEISAKR